MVSGLGRAVAAASCLFVAALPGACQDAVSDPLAVVVNEETRGALSLDIAVPSLPSVAERISDGGPALSDERMQRWIGAWQASWLAEDGEGRAARRAVYDEAVGPLAAVLGVDGVRAALGRVEDALEATGGADLSELPEPYRRRIVSARSRVAEARRDLEAGRTADALRDVLEAGDRLRDVSPRRVAESLLERAEEAQRRIPEISTYSRMEKERIARLVRNARDAVEAGEYTVAIHRAFYACQLLEVELN